MNPAERLARLRLARSDGVGPKTFAELLSRFGSAEAALDRLPALARKGGRDGRIASADDARRELDAAAAIGATILFTADAAYPALLGEVDPPPPVLCVLGDPAILNRDAVAMVGARNASANGCRFAESVARDLGARGFVVVSGLARGIDAAAHAGALSSGTVAVLAGGVDDIYPSEHAKLHAAILAGGGAIVSESPPGFQPKASHFPRRNRVISGLSRGTVVVEAAIGSGSLITARHAIEQNREVFAVPGSPLDPRSRGANDLIRQGAVLTESADDVIAALGAQPRLDLFQPQRRAPAPPPRTSAPPPRADILDLLGPTPVAIDEIVRRSGLEPDAVAEILLDLELEGRLRRSAGQQVSLL